MPLLSRVAGGSVGTLLWYRRLTFLLATTTFSRSMSFSTERSGDTITVSPSNEAEQSALLVICHGLGDTSEGFADVAEHLASEIPYLKIILPTAPTQAVSMNMGMKMPSWYDIVGLDERSNENCKGIEESRDKILAILEKEHSATGLSYERMVLGGFSQGGALSLWTGMQLNKKLAGVLMMSSYLPAAKKFTVSEENKETPILHCHGTADPLVTFEMAKKTEKALTEQKGVTEYELIPFEGLQHSVNMAEIGIAKNFLKRILPPDETCKIKLKDPSEMSVKELKAAIRKAGLGGQAVGLMEKSEFVKLLQDHRAAK
uniref:Phospholipase/carboxylesterase/thioesterase domain-containing protein n=1 Tax=Grammatophora oceanica TaxID=210454 RepID=A0A7S1UW47_9STRA|mmetsp:Transcript_26244/g.38447  ORF Transcript_26244/g.38447 Transcript_26244/m.38447 type:complete len:316 (+) Transcript_26244:78-1025(+)